MTLLALIIFVVTIILIKVYVRVRELEKRQHSQGIFNNSQVHINQKIMDIIRKDNEDEV